MIWKLLKGANIQVDETTKDAIRFKLKDIIKDGQTLLKTPVEVKPLSPGDAIGYPGNEKYDYPLLRKKEVLLQATFGNSIGQAFTGVPTSFNGSLEDVLLLDMFAIRDLAIFVAVLNAVLRDCGLIEKTVHCRNKEPVECGRQIAERFRKQYNRAKIGLVGYQPAFIEAFVDQFGRKNVKVTDLNPSNTGKTYSGVEIWDGIKKENEMISTSDLLLVTGSVFVNGTEEPFLEAAEKGKVVYFYGTTITGLAYLLDLPHVCPLSQ